MVHQHQGRALLLLGWGYLPYWISPPPLFLHFPSVTPLPRIPPPTHTLPPHFRVPTPAP